MKLDQTSSARDEALRAMLVHKADAEPVPSRTQMPRRSLVATIAAFTVVGGLAGGAVSAVALSNDQPGTTVISVDTSVRQAVMGDAKPLGTPFTYSGSGDAVLQLGTPPEGATDFIYNLRCLAASTYVTILDGDEGTRTTTACDQDAASSPFGGGGSQLAVTDSDSHSLTINSSAAYSIWGTWAAEPTPATPSATQTLALADGVVTREEYVTAYERFSACMSEAGFPLAFADMDQTVIEYSTSQASEADGASSRCYLREFEQVDIAWQIANEDTSDTARVLGECLLARGIYSESTVAEKLAQLEAASIAPEHC